MASAEQEALNLRPPLPNSVLVRGVLVDMDGTSVDSNPIVEASWAAVAEEFGLDLRDVLAFSHGRPGVETFQRFVPALSSADITERIDAMMAHEEELAHLVKPVPGAHAFLWSLERLGVPWALVTSAPRSLAAARFANAKLPWPKVAVTVEDVTAGKPNPEGYLTAAELLRVNTRDCLVFEDAPAGIRSALASGALVVAVNGSAPLTDAQLADESTLRGRLADQVQNLRGFVAERTVDRDVFRISWA